MSAVAIARRYGEALADVALALNQVEQIETEVVAFADLLRRNTELFDVFASPVVSQKEKNRVLEAIISRAGIGNLTSNLLRTMLRNYRLHHLGAVHEQFRRAINRRRGIAEAEVTTAIPISDSEQRALIKRLQEITGKQVEVQFSTDPALIGGVVTRIESIVYDGSIRTQLNTVKQKLKQGGTV
jgi:F-type H+-transporting ATPase subunit delta